MPYRNALRDNWQRFQDANDAEMRMYARESMASAQPMGEYAGGSLSSSDLYTGPDGSMRIRGIDYGDGILGPEQMGAVAQQPAMQQANVNYDPRAGLSAIERRKAELAAALQQY